MGTSLGISLPTCLVTGSTTCGWDQPVGVSLPTCLVTGSTTCGGDQSRDKSAYLLGDWQHYLWWGPACGGKSAYLFGDRQQVVEAVDTHFQVQQQETHLSQVTEILHQTVQRSAQRCQHPRYRSLASGQSDFLFLFFEGPFNHTGLGFSLNQILHKLNATQNLHILQT